MEGHHDTAARMAYPEAYSVISQLYQDWPEDYGSPEAAVDEYIAFADRERRTQAVIELRKLTADLSDEDLQRVTTAMSMCYAAEEGTRAFVDWIADRVEASLPAAG